MDLINKICIKIFCKKVGSDEFGNQYFTNKSNKRFVVYNGYPEPSKVPSEWHGWLHYSTNNLPDNTHKFSWQKIHLPNLSGTKNAYSPEKTSGKKTTSEYESWKPNS
jgi:NADH:ubiquinone oxidoreductase subunit